MKISLPALGVIALLSFPVFPAHAQEGVAAEKSVVAPESAAATKSSEEKSAEKSDASVPEREKNPYQDDIAKMAKVLAKEYNQDQAMALAQIRNGYGMIGAVGLVKKDVAKAVAACGTDNPDMKDKISARFDVWDAAIEPVLEKNRERMEESIQKIGFPDEKKVKSYLALVDKSAAYANSKVEKNIITTPEVCGNLLESMDSTGPTMVQLLEDIVWPGLAPVSVPVPENKNDAAEDVKSVP